MVHMSLQATLPPLCWRQIYSPFVSRWFRGFPKMVSSDIAGAGRCEAAAGGVEGGTLSRHLADRGGSTESAWSGYWRGWRPANLGRDRGRPLDIRANGSRCPDEQQGAERGRDRGR